MDILEKYGLKDIHYWHNYSPHEAQYMNFEPYILAAAYKITDVYHALCNARANIYFLNIDDYGVLVERGHDLSNKYMHSHFIQNSVVFYNIALDLSWKVVWLFYRVKSYEVLFNDYFHKITKNCNYDRLVEELEYQYYLAGPTERRRIYNIRACVKSFFSSLETQDVREKYNYLKHRGTYHFIGLGQNYKNLMFGVNGHSLPMLHRMELDIECLINTLTNYDKRFVSYLEEIISYILPEDYLDAEIDIFSGSFALYQKLKSYY